MWNDTGDLAFIDENQTWWYIVFTPNIMSSPMADTFSVRLPEDLRAEVDRIAESTQRSRAFIIKAAVEAYVDEHHAYFNAIDEAIAEADMGVFISGGKARQWMRDLRANPNTPLPKPDVFKK